MSLDKSITRERLSFTLYLAIAVHAAVILGIEFTEDDSKKTMPTLNVTLASHQATKTPDQADYLAQFDQEASGTIDENKELTSRETTEIVAPNINQVAPVPKQKTQLANVTNQQFITTDKSTAEVARQEEQDRPDAKEQLDAEDEDSPMLSPEIASLRAKLDQLQQEFAKRPRIRRMTSVATRSSYDAAYLNSWTIRVERMGNQHFPEAALEQKIFGSLRMSVLVNSDGTVDSIEILKPSGHPVLDQAAVQIVRLAAPFEPFPSEIRETADQLDIIRTWRFEITGLKAGSDSGE